MKIGISRGRRSSGEEPLFGRIHDEGDIHLRFRTKTKSRLKNLQRNGCGDQPSAVRRKLGESFDARNRQIIRMGTHAGGGKFSTPPRPVGCKVKFKVASRCRVAEKKLCHIVFPKLGSKLARSGIWVNDGRFASGRNKPETSMINRHPKGSGDIERFPIPIILKAKKSEIEGAPVQRFVFVFYQHEF